MSQFRGHILRGLWAVPVAALFIAFQNFSPASQSLDPLSHAHKMHRRLAGVALPMDDPRILEMAALIEQNRKIDAARIATEHPEFLGITVREMASKLSTRDADVSLPLNDFIAGFIGSVRDERDIREVLYENFWYRGDPEKVPGELRSDIKDDILLSENHYRDLENANFKEALVRVEGQLILNDQEEPTAHPEPAGLLTSRAWQLAHMTAGTNRAPIESLMVGFACIPMLEAHDTSLPDLMVGRDVSRAPDGTYQSFQNSCKGCHSFMDGWRPAFAYFDFENNRSKHSFVYSQRGSGAQRMRFQSNSIRVPAKFYRGQEEAPEGFGVTNNSWVNFSAQSDKGQYQFGWAPQSGSGQGLPQFGEMFSKARIVSECLVQRTFRAVCRREVAPQEATLVRALASEFRSSHDYNLKDLFHTVAARPECLGH